MGQGEGRQVRGLGAPPGTDGRGVGGGADLWAPPRWSYLPGQLRGPGWRVSIPERFGLGGQATRCPTAAVDRAAPPGVVGCWGTPALEVYGELTRGCKIGSVHQPAGTAPVPMPLHAHAAKSLSWMILLATTLAQMRCLASGSQERPGQRQIYSYKPCSKALLMKVCLCY